MTKRRRDSLIRKVKAATARWRHAIEAEARKAKIKGTGRYSARARRIAKTIQDGGFYDEHLEPLHTLAELMSGEKLPPLVRSDDQSNYLPPPYEWTAVVPLRVYDDHDYPIGEPMVVIEEHDGTMEGIIIDGQRGNYLSRRKGFSRPATAREIARITDEQLEEAASFIS